MDISQMNKEKNQQIIMFCGILIENKNALNFYVF